MNAADVPTYRTDHLYLAAFLTCSGHEVVGTASDGSCVSFVFHQTPELSAAVAGFMSGAVIPARRFSFEVLKLKRLIPRSPQKMEKIINGNHIP
ncbi:MAG TPA: hypothetical protein VLV88_13660 [Terriglobales bacterium]|nr:hypothetical protein [Candidatus Bathyarchaeia archaeon]HUL17039.1 hypothetical protein [Terriglobales bacterium]